ncbi:tuberous sclerosis 2 [Phakopsora pachyrhizi]|nr:tuberous sclerosis 2 [Phakopsora pachyrhizi]
MPTTAAAIERIHLCSTTLASANIVHQFQPPLGILSLYHHLIIPSAGRHPINHQTRTSSPHQVKSLSTQTDTQSKLWVLNSIDRLLTASSASETLPNQLSQAQQSRARQRSSTTSSGSSNNSPPSIFTHFSHDIHTAWELDPFLIWPSFSNSIKSLLQSDLVGSETLFIVQKIRLRILNACIRSYNHSSLEHDLLRSLSFIEALKNCLGTPVIINHLLSSEPDLILNSVVKKIINLFVNQIGSNTTSEAHLSIVLDYISTLIVFGYVPTHNLGSPAQTHDQHQLCSSNIDAEGESLLIDIVRFVAKIVGLEGLDGVVFDSKLLIDQHLSDNLKRVSSYQNIYSPIDSPDSSSTTDVTDSPSYLINRSQKFEHLDSTIIQKAKQCIKDLIRSPSHQAIKSLLKTLTLENSQIDQVSIVGALRCLRYAFDDYDLVCNQKRSSSSSVNDDRPSGIEVSLALLGLGLVLVKDALKSIIASPFQPSLETDLEIIMLLQERLKCSLRNSNKSRITHIKKEEQLDCAMDLMLVFLEFRIPIWLGDSRGEKSKALLIREQPMQKNNLSSLLPTLFGDTFNILFKHQTSRIHAEDDQCPMSFIHENVNIEKYFDLCLRFSKYMSDSLKNDLIFQIDSYDFCSPENVHWVTYLKALSQSLFKFEISTRNYFPEHNKCSPPRSSNLSLKSKPEPETCQIQLILLLKNIFEGLQDLNEWKDELLDGVILPTFVHILLSSYPTSHNDSTLVDLVLNFIRDILQIELLNDLLDDQEPRMYDQFLRLLMLTATMRTSAEFYLQDTLPTKIDSAPSHPTELSSTQAALSTTSIAPAAVLLKAPTTISTSLPTRAFSPTRAPSQADHPHKQRNPFHARRRELSYKAVVTLVKLFGDSLKVSTTYSNSKCARVFSELLLLIKTPCDLNNSNLKTLGSVASFSLSDLDHDLTRRKDDESELYQVDSRTKLVVLKLLLRLRADEDHRVQFVRDLEIDGLASIVGRVDELCDQKTNSQVLGPLEQGSASTPSKKTAVRSTNTTPSSRKPHGLRKPTADDQSNLKRSTAASAAKPLYSSTRSSHYSGEENMLWKLPEDLSEFDWPSKIETYSTHGLVTFDHVIGRDGDPSKKLGSSSATKLAPNCNHVHSPSSLTVLSISDYLAVIIGILRYETDWEIVSYVLCLLPAQLSNKHFACGPLASKQIHQLRRLLCNGIKSDSLLHQVRFSPGQRVKLTDAHAISYQTLSTLIAYKPLFDKSQADEMIIAFVKGLSRYKDTAKACIHALALSCHELQPSITKFLPEILRGLTKIVSSAFVSVHILELLGFLGQIPGLYANLTEDEYKMIFGIALQYITNHNQHQQAEELRPPYSQTPPKSSSAAISLQFNEGEVDEENSRIEEDIQAAFDQYVYLMAFYLIALWFVSLRLSDRKKYVTFITRKLIQACEGKQELDEMTEVCFDMLNRYTYSNAEPKPRKKHSKFNEIINSSLGKPVRTSSWILGNSILTIKCLSRPGWTEVCVRRPSGMVKMIWELENLSGDHSASEQDVLEMVIRHRNTLYSAASNNEGDDGGKGNKSVSEKDCDDRLGNEDIHDEILEGDGDSEFGKKSHQMEPDNLGHNLKESSKVKEVTLTSVMNQSAEITQTTGIDPNYTNLSVEPSFFALQLLPFGDVGHTNSSGGEPIRNRPIRVPENPPSLEKLVEMIDYLSVVDFHKIGVLYVGPGQTTEEEILKNREGSKDYIDFISSLGQLISLKGCENYNTGGLDCKEDLNGRFAYMWGDDITQICFHIATLMPSSREKMPREGGEDPILNKKALIGNDFVKIVFNNSGKDYQFDCIGSQFNYINIIIEPNTPINSSYNLKTGIQNEVKFFKISLQRKDGLPKIGPIENFKMISSQSLGGFIRSLAVHANTFAQVYLECVGTESRNPSIGVSTPTRQENEGRLHQSQAFSRTKSTTGGNGGGEVMRSKLEYVSNWRARLRAIRRLKDRILMERNRNLKEQKTDEGGAGSMSSIVGGSVEPSRLNDLSFESTSNYKESNSHEGSHNQQQQQQNYEISNEISGIDVEELSSIRDFSSWT